MCFNFTRNVKSEMRPSGTVSQAVEMSSVPVSPPVWAEIVLFH